MSGAGQVACAARWARAALNESTQAALLALQEKHRRVQGGRISAWDLTTSGRLPPAICWDRGTAVVAAGVRPLVQRLGSGAELNEPMLAALLAQKEEHCPLHVGTLGLRWLRQGSGRWCSKSAAVAERGTLSRGQNPQHRVLQSRVSLSHCTVRGVCGGGQVASAVRRRWRGSMSRCRRHCWHRRRSSARRQILLHA